MTTTYPTLTSRVESGAVDVSVTSAYGGAGAAVSYSGVTDSVLIWNQDLNFDIQYKVDSADWVTLGPNKQATFDLDMSASTVRLRLSEFAPTARAAQLQYTPKPSGVFVIDAEGRRARFDDVSTGQIKTISADRAAVASDNGKTLVFSAAYTYTIGTNLPEGFSVAVRPPNSGNASIARSSPVTLNGGTSTLTRTQAANTLFAVVQIGTDAYAVTGS